MRGNINTGAIVKQLDNGWGSLFGDVVNAGESFDIEDLEILH